MALFHRWNQPAVKAVAEDAGLATNHTNCAKSFPFARLAPLPDGEKGPVRTRVPLPLPASAMPSAMAHPVADIKPPRT